MRFNEKMGLKSDELSNLSVNYHFIKCFFFILKIELFLDSLERHGLDILRYDTDLGHF
jgi:hypothetical protein